MNYRAQNEPHPSQIDRFLAWAFGWTWGFWGAAVLLRNLWAGNPVEISLLLLGAFGPMAASFAVLKKKSLKNIFSFLFSGNKGAWRYFFIYGGVWTAVVAVSSKEMPTNANLISLPLHVAVTAIIGGGQEEPGWRGFLQPALEKKFSFLPATLMVGIVWAVWHVPLWFLEGTSQHGTSFPIFVLSSMVLAVWFAGLYRRTQAVFVCALFHALYNVAAAKFTGLGNALNFGDLSEINQSVYLGGIAALTAYSVYLWYKSDL